MKNKQTNKRESVEISKCLRIRKQNKPIDKVIHKQKHKRQLCLRENHLPQCHPETSKQPNELTRAHLLTVVAAAACDSKNKNKNKPISGANLKDFC